MLGELLGKSGRNDTINKYIPYMTKRGRECTDVTPRRECERQEAIRRRNRYCLLKSGALSAQSTGSTTEAALKMLTEPI
ncbi:hypothetical protein EVAR_68875_1 [Eumeta japonica]|uniref:Uncharacterized protein n=1 Tax=Eumeta variegata TaxID=151549 RepID=A0A4C2AFL9_EUMVA|nr:hypothetical protein EVAR_68875_1 [Eumeta japonica]